MVGEISFRSLLSLIISTSIRLYLTASIGVTSTLQSPADDAKQLIQHADYGDCTKRSAKAATTSISILQTLVTVSMSR